MLYTFLRNYIFQNFIVLGIHLGYFINKTVDNRLHMAFEGSRGKLEIFRIESFFFFFFRFLNFYVLFIRYRPNFLFTTNIENSSRVIYEFVAKTRHSCFTHIWLGGILTNTNVAQDDLIARDQFFFQKFIDNNYPNFIFLFNLNVENFKVLNEAFIVNVPVVAFIDSYNTLSFLDYFILGNNDSELILRFYLYFFINFVFNSFLFMNGKKFKYRMYAISVNIQRQVGFIAELISEKQFNLSVYLYVFFKRKFWEFRKKKYLSFVQDIVMAHQYVDFFKSAGAIRFENRKIFFFVLKYFRRVFLKSKILKLFRGLKINYTSKKLYYRQIPYLKYVQYLNFFFLGQLRSVFLNFGLHKLKNKLLYFVYFQQKLVVALSVGFALYTVTESFKTITGSNTIFKTKEGQYIQRYLAKSGFKKRGVPVVNFKRKHSRLGLLLKLLKMRRREGSSLFLPIGDVLVQEHNKKSLDVFSKSVLSGFSEELSFGVFKQGPGFNLKNKGKVGKNKKKKS